MDFSEAHFFPHGCSYWRLLWFPTYTDVRNGELIFLGMGIDPVLKCLYFCKVNRRMTLEYNTQTHKKWHGIQVCKVEERRVSRGVT